MKCIQWQIKNKYASVLLFGFEHYFNRSIVLKYFGDWRFTRAVTKSENFKLYTGRYV